VGSARRALERRLRRGRRRRRGAAVIRCVFVNHYTGYGGAELMLLTLFERLDRSRVTPILIAPGEGVLTAGARSLGVETRIVPVAPSLLGVARGGAGSRLGAVSAVAALPATAHRLARAIRGARADVVVTNSAKAHVYGSLAGRLARRPVVWRMHDTMDSSDFAGSTRRLLLAIGRRVPALVLPVSDSTGRALIEGGIPRERVATLYNGIDLAALRAGAARVPPSPNGVPRVGSVGRITPLKGHAVVIDAAARLLERGVDARFVIAGAAAGEAPGHLAELRARVERLGIADRVELISPFGDLGELLAGLDVLVHASVLPDSLPTTVIESMALGKPVVAAELGGVPELVRDEETGFLVPPNDPARMADAIAALIESPERRAVIGAAAFAEATARFDVQTFADAFTAHLEAAAT
jgi:glycosyltransferase involved in cell wall biosynthesis